VEFVTSVGRLWVREQGAGGDPLVALHGFTLHGGMFAALADKLGTEVLAPDLPGHGRTVVTPATTANAVTALREWLDGFATPPVLLGYSLGGRIAYQIAISEPRLVRGLVLVSTSPGLTGAERSARGEADATLADRIESMGMEQFIDEWLSHPITATDSLPVLVRDADRSLRLENTAAGLAAALRGMGQATTEYAGAALAVLPVPIGFVAGERDAKYCDLAAAMAAPRGERPVIVPGAGHNVILQNPAAIADVVRGLRVSRRIG
jgi:2-succinyl-6-hydroxy-2,4-cyclohexadiene-1-carboxylate synthase